MDKKEAFKEYIKNNRYLTESVLNKEVTYQKLYELYDIYGPDDTIFSRYKKERSSNIDLKKIGDAIKNINMDDLEKHIDNAKKALGVISAFSTKKVDNIANNLPKKMNRPNDINSFFED